MCGPLLGDAKNSTICDTATSCFLSYYMFIKSQSCPPKKGGKRDSEYGWQSTPSPLKGNGFQTSPICCRMNVCVSSEHKQWILQLICWEKKIVVYAIIRLNAGKTDKNQIEQECCDT